MAPTRTGNKKYQDLCIFGARRPCKKVITNKKNLKKSEIDTVVNANEHVFTNLYKL